MMMDYEQFLAAKAAGTATMTIDKPESAPVPVALANESIVVTSKRFDPFTGREVEPAVIRWYKRDLLAEVAGIEQQITLLTEKKEAIASLLTEFDPVGEQVEL